MMEVVVTIGALTHAKLQSKAPVTLPPPPTNQQIWIRVSILIKNWSLTSLVLSSSCNIASPNYSDDSSFWTTGVNIGAEFFSMTECSSHKPTHSNKALKEKFNVNTMQR